MLPDITKDRQHLADEHYQCYQARANGIHRYLYLYSHLQLCAIHVNELGIKTMESLTLFWVIFRPSSKCPNRTFTFQRVCFMKARFQRVWSNLLRGNRCHSWFTTSNPSPQEPHCEVSPTIHTHPLSMHFGRKGINDTSTDQQDHLG